MKTTRQIHSTQVCENVPRGCLFIPHTMELVETVKLLELLMGTNRFLYPCGDYSTVFKMLSIIKPLDKLAKLRDNWQDRTASSTGYEWSFDHLLL
jgi:hypothetical protein